MRQLLAPPQVRALVPRRPCLRRVSITDDPAPLEVTVRVRRAPEAMETPDEPYSGRRFLWTPLAEQAAAVPARSAPQAAATASTYTHAVESPTPQTHENRTVRMPALVPRLGGSPPVRIPNSHSAGLHVTAIAATRTRFSEGTTRPDIVDQNRQARLRRRWRSVRTGSIPKGRISASLRVGCVVHYLRCFS